VDTLFQSTSCLAARLLEGDGALSVEQKSVKSFDRFWTHLLCHRLAVAGMALRTSIRRIDSEEIVILLRGLLNWHRRIVFLTLKNITGAIEINLAGPSGLVEKVRIAVGAVLQKLKLEPD
jgi:hypothetical protein